MSSLAVISHERGITVGGSDLCRADIAPKMPEGIKIYKEHKRENIIEFFPDLVVYSMAIGEENPELSYAKSLGIRTLTRAEYESALIAEYPMNIAVAGSHGKSTVTALIYSGLLGAKIDAGVLSGAKTEQGSNFAIGKDMIVYEACEYKNSFLSFTPDIAVVTNLELDHTDFFRSLTDIKNSFLIYINSATRFAVLNGDDENIRSL